MSHLKSIISCVNLLRKTPFFWSSSPPPIPPWTKTKAISFSIRGIFKTPFLNPLSPSLFSQNQEKKNPFWAKCFKNTLYPNGKKNKICLFQACHQKPSKLSYLGKWTPQKKTRTENSGPPSTNIMGKSIVLDSNLCLFSRTSVMEKKGKKIQKKQSQKQKKKEQISQIERVMEYRLWNRWDRRVLD